MLKKLRTHWKAFKASRPGHRFQDVHERPASNGGGRSSRLRHVGMIVLGILLTAAGVVFLPAPGPGSIVLLAGIGIIASESLMVARFLDRTEVVVRPWARRAVRWWHGLSGRSRLLFILTTVLLAGAAALAFYIYFIR